jgi:hypothetical protein
VIEIDANIDIDKIELFFSKIKSDEAKGIQITHPLSQKFPPGIMSSLIHFICSWGRLNPDGIVVTNFHDQSSLNGLMDEIYANPHILTLFLIKNFKNLYFKNNTSLISNVSSQIIREYAEIEEIFKEDKLILMDKMIKSLELINDPETKREKEKEIIANRKKIANKIKKIKNNIIKENSTNIFLLCNDSDPRLQFPNYFYNKNQDIKSGSQLKDLIKSIFLNSSIDRNNEPHQIQIYFHLSLIIKELIENTHYWGRTHYLNEEPYNPNIRAAYLSLYTNITKEISNIPTDPIEEYISSLDLNHLLNLDQAQIVFFDEKEKTKNIGLFEISIIDSGPGFPRRWLKKEFDQFSKEEEIKAILECFKKNMTSDKSSIRFLRGNGLTSIIEIIGKKGFIKIRTGRTLLYRNFLNDPLDYDGEILNKNIHFEIFSNELSESEGTLISVFYPFIFTK